MVGAACMVSLYHKHIRRVNARGTTPKGFARGRGCTLSTLYVQTICIDFGNEKCYNGCDIMNLGGLLVTITNAKGILV